MDKKLLSLKNTDDILACSVPEAQLAGAWWANLGRANEPVTGEDLRELASEVLLDGQVKVATAAKQIRPDDAEGAFLHAVSLAKSLLKRATSMEIKANQPPFKGRSPGCACDS